MCLYDYKWCVHLHVHGGTSGNMSDWQQNRVSELGVQTVSREIAKQHLRSITMANASEGQHAAQSLSDSSQPDYSMTKSAFSAGGQFESKVSNRYLWW